MKLVIQIPCYNEEETLEQTLRDLPVSLPGLDSIEVLIIDDGSTDSTYAAAARGRAHRLIRFRKNRGLASAFCAGLETALEMGADIIVNTDADNQYFGQDIDALIRPILEQKADIAIGDRGVASLNHFSWAKRRMQTAGSAVLGAICPFSVPDATSGFRAFTREAAMRLTVLGEYSHTLETLIQAGARGMSVRYVPVRTHPQARSSRLIKSMPSFLTQSTASILRFYLMYRPLRIFMILGVLPLLAGTAIGIRFLIHLWLSGGVGHTQSLILSAILIIVGFQTCLFGLLAELVRLNRKMLEEALFGIRRLESHPPPLPPIFPKPEHDPLQ